MMDDSIKIRVTDGNGAEDVKIKVTDTTGSDNVKIKVTDSDPGGEPFEDIGTGRDFEHTSGPARSGLGNLLGQAARLSFNLMTKPLDLLPNEARYHAKNSLREGVLSFKVLVDDIAGTLDRNLSQSMERDRPAASPEPDRPIKPARPGGSDASEQAGDDARAI